MTWNTDDLRPEALRLYDAKMQGQELHDLGGALNDGPLASEIDDAGNDSLTGLPVGSAWLAAQPWAQEGDTQDGVFTGEHIDVAANGPMAARVLHDAPPIDPAEPGGLDDLWQNTKHGTVGLPIQLLETFFNLFPGQDPEANAAVGQHIEAMRKQLLGPDPYDEQGIAAMLSDPTMLAGLGLLAKPDTWAKLLKAGKVAMPAAAGMAVSEDAEGGPLSSAVAKAVRALPKTATKADAESAMLAADPKMNTGKAANYAARVEAINKETTGLLEGAEMWRGSMGAIDLGHAEFGGYHVMLEHRGDLINIIRAAGGDQRTVQAMSNTDLLKGALDVLDGAKTSKDGTRRVGNLVVKIVMRGKDKIGTFYVVGR